MALTVVEEDGRTEESPPTGPFSMTMVEEDGRTEETPPPGPSSSFTLRTSHLGLLRWGATAEPRLDDSLVHDSLPGLSGGFSEITEMEM